jgi:murein DD-endopeptidase MepM/ murein hydrolase activator NlpD
MKTRAVLIAVLFAVPVFAGPQARVHGKKADKKTLSSNLKSVKDKKKAVVRQLSTTKKQVREVRGDIRDMDVRLNKLETDLDNTRDRLSASRSEQKKLTASLADATQRLKVTREAARKRIRELYMQGDGTVVAAFSSSSDYADFLSRRFVFERIATRDRDLFQEYKRLRDEVADRKKRADGLVVRIGGLVRDQQVQQSDLEDTRADKGQLLSQLRGKQKTLEQIVAELDAEEQSIESQIAAYNRGQGRSNNLSPFTGRFLRPVPGPITSGYGMRMHPIIHRPRMHTGIDMGARYGSPISAAADGVVISASYHKGYGNTVILDHGGGTSTLYGHCSRLFVSNGQKVRRGQKIAAVGSTGLSTGPHLHFEVRKNGKPTNPAGRF